MLGTDRPQGNLSYAYDAAGNLVERSSANAQSSGGTSTSQYDAAGRLTQLTAPDGKTTRYTYDPAGRLITTERALNPVPAGQPNAGQAQSLISHQRYDAADRMIAVAHVKQIGAGSAASSLIAGQAITKVAGGAISAISTYRADTANPASTANYDPATGQFAGSATHSVSYEFDANARLTRENSSAAATSSTAALSADTRYSYDAAGNRLQKLQTTAAGTAITTYSYDNADRLTSESVSLPAGGSNQVSYTWDGNGNLASKLEATQATLYRWDASNRLIDIRVGASVQAATAAMPQVSYRYDASGNRIARATAASAGGSNAAGQRTTNYLIDSNHGYAQVALESTVSSGTGTSTAATAYLWGAGLIRQTQVAATAATGGALNLYGNGNGNGGNAATDFFPMPGHLGTSLGAVDANGSIAGYHQLESYGGDEYGGQVPATPQGGLNHRYTGEYYDADSGLTYLRARWYDAKMGRFISADPFEGKQTDPRSLNRYAYAHNDPVHQWDPSGKMSMGEIGVGLNIGLTLANVAVTSFLVTTDVMNGNYTGAAKELAISLVIGKLSTVGSFARAVVAKSFGIFSALTRSSRTVTLYRAVEPAKYASIMASKQFSWGSFPTNMKQFGFTLEEALAYANTNPAYSAIIKVTVDKSAVAFGQFSKTIDPWIFKNGVLTFSEFGPLNSAIRSISHVF